MSNDKILKEREETPSSFFTVYQLYTPEEVKQIRSIIDNSKWNPGKARTPELTEQLKHNEELLSSSSEAVSALIKVHADKMANDVQIKTDHIVKGVSPPKFNKYSAPGGDYQRHTDSPVMAGVRTDLASTTFLSDPEDCIGGELNIEDEFGNIHSFKGKLGQTVVYPCGMPHWVTPVTKGERVSIICWIQSYIRDVSKRKILTNMIKSLHKIEDRSFEDKLLRDVWTELGSVHASLFKMWME